MSLVMENFMSWKEYEKEHYLQTGHRRLDKVIVRGERCNVWDEEGKQYLDFIGGWASLSLGHSHFVVLQAIQEQAEKLLVATNDVYTIPQLQLTKTLLSLTPEFNKAYFQNSGAEAVELAIKLARKYGKEKLNGAYEIICFDHAFHGRTMGALSATGKPEYQKSFQPLVPGFLHPSFNDIDALEQSITNNTCAIMLELIQAEGGVYKATDDFVDRIQSICKSYDCLLIVDEIQTGICRTGKWFAYQHYNIQPDILILGKGLGGGVPISGVLMNDKLQLGQYEHGTTFGGNPFLCHVANKVVCYLDNIHADKIVREKGLYLMTKLYEAGFKARGRGLLVAFEIDGDSIEFSKKCADNYLLVNPVTETAIRLMPPLIVTYEEMDRAIDILVEVAK